MRVEARQPATSQPSRNPSPSQLFKPDAGLHGFSVDVVDMQEIAGPHHVHPHGEIDLVMPLAGAGIRQPARGLGVETVRERLFRNGASAHCPALPRLWRFETTARTLIRRPSSGGRSTTGHPGRTLAMTSKCRIPQFNGLASEEGTHFDMQVLLAAVVQAVRRPRLITLEETCERVGMKPSFVHAEAAAGRFPRPVKLGASKSKRAAARFVDSEVTEYINQRIAERDQAQE